MGLRTDALAPDAPLATAVIAVDGPSGSGKSTVARGVAAALGWRYVDTGATYRAVTLAVLRAGHVLGGVDDPTHPAVSRAAEADVVATATSARVGLGTDPTAPSVLLDGEDVSALVRGAEVTQAVSAVSALPEVRAHLVALQRSLIGDGEAVVEGRDICAVVAPAARVKVFLDADPDVRAARRAADADAGVAPACGKDLAEAVRADLARRDAHDRGRAAHPLAAAPDAVHVDASHLDAAQVVARVLELAAEAGFHAVRA